MKKLILIYFLTALFFIFACAREKAYVKTVRPPLSTIILPKKKLPKPYEINGKRYYPLPDAHGFIQSGKASWYGKKFHGRPTANGEIFNMYKKSAAHKTLPLGTYVKVLNLSNKKQIVLRINDRGPFVKGRIIDLSYAAAKEINLIGPGVVDVKIVAMGREADSVKSGNRPSLALELRDLKNGAFTIQVGAFQDRGNAMRLADRMEVIFSYVKVRVYMDENNKPLHRVYVSKSKTLVKANKMERKLEEMGFKGAFIVRI